MVVHLFFDDNSRDIADALNNRMRPRNKVVDKPQHTRNFSEIAHSKRIKLYEN